MEKIANKVDIVEIKKKQFEVLLSSEKIQERIRELSEEILVDNLPENTLILGVLQGAFIFMADIVRALERDFVTEFVRLNSYIGMESGELLIGKHKFRPSDYDLILIIEDIVDTGQTLSRYKKYLYLHDANNIKIVTLLRKPATITEHITVDYVGFDIPDDFVVGYGMDYDGYGRGLEHIYKVVDE